jgi:hypothetical protein
MHDAGVGWDDLEVAERALTPAQERVPFLVAGELELGVERERVFLPEVIHLHRVIDDELYRLQRVHPVGVAAERDDRIAHRREIDHARDPGEVLQEDARRHERDFLLGRRLRVPLRQRADVIRLDEGVVLAPQQVLEEDLHRVRQPRDARKSRPFERRKAENRHRLSANAEIGAGAEAVHGCHKESTRQETNSQLRAPRELDPWELGISDCTPPSSPSRNSRATSAGSRRVPSTALFIRRIAAASMRPARRSSAPRSSGKRSTLAACTSGTAS